MNPPTTSQVVIWLLIVVIRCLEEEKCMYQHRGRRIVVAFSLASALLVPVISAGAQAPADKQTPADNTKVNERDRAPDAVTADQQKENTSDREITQKIRSALVGDETLSTYAHNVKVVAQDGRVTLKGPVRTEDEKKTVEAKATEVAGAGRVTNQLTIAPEKGSKK
jgi:hyperosmotically inducible periplasmic protein